MLGKVLHVGLVEVALTAVQGEEGAVDAYDLHLLHRDLGEVEACSRCGGGTLVFGEDTLEGLEILLLGLALDICGQWCHAEGVEVVLKLLVGAVVQESQSASAAGGVVYHFGHEGVVLTKVKLIADANLACGVYGNVPQTVFGIEFPAQEYLNAGTGALLVAV